MADWNPRANDLFLQAIDLPPAERPAFLARECGDDAGLRKAVEALLRAHEQAASFLAEPAVGEPTHSVGGTAAYPPVQPGEGAAIGEPGQLIAGRYKLLERIGEGGMGSVWMAEQTEPVKRKVAVKLIKAGLDTKTVLARFEAERQALALMDHPNIAKVLDGGVHDGQPFFVMELVKGVPITDFCDARKLTPAQRLELFVPVCQAIQHAHQKGVIHRDIKPANVLVALYDDRPVPKVIDFGVAKATGPTLTEHTLNTGFGGIVGTPQYMSPEQATFNNLDIDTRSDVYSLGVLLYELLAGSPPFKQKELEKRGLLEILRVVREEEPPKPSTKLSTADALPSLSANRGMEPKKLTGLLRNELDWIVMKALEKDRTRRYETANGFAADVQRYLSGEPVLAHPPTAAYRLRKFVRKNKGPVVAGALLLLTLSLGIAGTTFGLVKAEQRRREAEQARRQEMVRADGEQKAKEHEAEQREKAEKAYTMTADVLNTMTSSVTGDSLVAPKEINSDQKMFLAAVLKYYRECAGETANDVKSRARAARAAYRVGYIEHNMGRKAEAATAFRSAREAYRSLAADCPAVPAYRQELARSHNALGILLANSKQWAEAEAEIRTGLALQEQLVAQHSSWPEYRLGLAHGHVSLGALLKGKGHLAEAERQHRKALAIREQLVADFPAVPTYRTELGKSYYNFGTLARDDGKPADSLEWFRKAIQTLQPARENQWRDATAISYLRNSYSHRATAHNQLKKYAEAVKDWDKVIELSPPKEQPGHRASRALAKVNAGQVAEAVSEVAELRKLPGWDANQLYNFACVYSVASGKVADKKTVYADAAMEMLTKAVTAGYKNHAHMKRDKDLDPLRGRDDFRKLLAELEAKFPPKREVLPPPRRE